MRPVDIFQLLQRRMTTMSKEVAKIKLLREGAKIPTRGSEKAAGWDIYSCTDEEVIIEPGEMVKVPTGISITPPPGYFGAIFARSGLSTKQGLRPANCVGVCDEDYTGPYIVALYNDSDEPQHIPSGTRIAQLVFMPYKDIVFLEVDELKETDRGSNGFGSTGN